MEIVKKNILSIIFGVLALIAVIAWIWPLGSVKAEAEQALTKRAAVGSSMQGILSRERKLPVVSLEGEQSPKLDVFPTQRVIDWGKDVQAQLKAQTQEVRAMALAMNRKPVLVERSLPVPAPTKDFDFRDIYLKYVQQFARMFGAAAPPNAALINEARENLWKEKYGPQIIYRDNQAVNQQQVEAEFAKESAEVPTRVKEGVAHQILFYMDPLALDQSTQIVPNSATPPTALIIWDAQLKLWVQQDICSAIRDLNARESKNKNVTDAPVKYLLKADLRVEGGMFAKMLQDAEGQTTGRLDTQRISRRDTSPRISSTEPAATTWPCASTTTRLARASASSR